MPDLRRESLEAIQQAAADWLVRLEAGLSPEEEQAFAAWVEADPRHADVLAEQQETWERFGSLAGEVAGTAPDPARFAPPSAKRIVFTRFLGPALAAAAALALLAYLWAPHRSTPEPAPLALPALLEQRTLPDGSIVELNRNAEISVAFTATARRVELLRGEASFAVAKNPAVPFIVSAGGVEARAVGTAFNVHYGRDGVEVLVTEGTVAVENAPPADREGREATASFQPVLLTKGQRTLVALGGTADTPAVATLTPAEIDARLAWQPKLLDFDDTPLPEIVAEFNRRNPVQLVIGDSSLATLRLNASFRSDNVEGFVRLLETHFGLCAEPLTGTSIALRRAR